MPYGLGTLSVEQKTRAAVRFEFDQVGLANLVVGDMSTPLSLALSLNANELELLLQQGARVLAHMMDVHAIGVDTLTERNAHAIERLSHVTAEPVHERMTSAERAEMRRLAIAEIDKVREAKRRGDYGVQCRGCDQAAAASARTGLDHTCPTHGGAA